MPFLSSEILRDVIANRPAAGSAGRIFFSSDTNKTYRDNGSSWEDCSDSGVVPAARTINTTAPLTGGGDLSADRTLAISNFTGDSGSGGAKGAVPAPAAGDAAAGKFLKASGGFAVPPGTGVTSVALTVPARQSVSGSPITGAGTLAVTDNTQSANQVFAGPSSGSAAAPTFRAAVAADIPNIAESQVTNLTTDLAAKASSVAVQQEAYTYATDTGSANAYAVTLSPAPTIVAGSEVVFIAAHANTTASTLAVNGAGAVAIKKNGNSTALASGDIAAGQIITAKYDGTVYQISVPGSGGGAVSSLTTTGSSGAATLSSGVLNIPVYSGSGSLPAYIQPSTAVPTVASLTALNQSTSTATDTAAGIFVRQPVGATTYVFALIQATPSAPWTFTAAVTMIVYGGNSIHLGICCSDGTKIITFGPQFSSGLTLAIRKWTNANTYSGTDYSPTTANWPTVSTAVIWLRIKDDNTNRILSYSFDGVNFIQMHSVGRTDFLTASNVGIFAVGNGAAVDGYLTCSSWLVTSP